MFKKIITLFILILLLPCSGCNNYVGVDEISIVSGIAVDKNTENGNYMLTFEVIDLTNSSPDKGIVSNLVESEGKTPFDAVRNAKKRIMNKLYFGNADILIISKAIAAEEGIENLLDSFIRDAETRPNLNVIISQEELAKNLLLKQGIENKVISYEIRKVLANDEKVTGSSYRVPIYKLYGLIKNKGKSFVLPVFQVIQNDNQPAIEINGVSIFKNGKLTGYLSSEEAKIFLFAVNKKKGGIFTVNYESERDNISLEISLSNTQRSFTNENGVIKMKISTHTDVFAGEDMGHRGKITEDDLNKIQQAAETKLKNDILSLIKSVQENYNADIFGFANLIYKRDPKLWKEIESGWDETFKTLEIETECKFRITNTANVI